MDSMVQGSVVGAARCLSGARATESGPVVAVGACQVLSVLLKRRARGPGRLVWPGSGTGVLVVDYLVLGSVAEAVRGWEWCYMAAGWRLLGAE